MLLRDILIIAIIPITKIQMRIVCYTSGYEIPYEVRF